MLTESLPTSTGIRTPSPKSGSKVQKRGVTILILVSVLNGGPLVSGNCTHLAPKMSQIVGMNTHVPQLS